MELPGVPNDTARASEARLIAGLRRLTPAQRLERTIALCRAATEWACAGMAARDAELGPREMRAKLALLRYGPELCALVEAHRVRLGAG